LKILDVVELTAEGFDVEDKEKNYLDDGGSLAAGNYPTEDEEPINIAGEWLVVNELIEVDNDYLVYISLESEDITLVQLPGKYVEEDYLIDYDATDECPLGVDVLVREDGFNIKVVPGCDYQAQANVNNHLDGHKYTGYLGFKVNDDYFVTYRDDKFEMISL
jgi:hypothetical protein